MDQRPRLSEHLPAPVAKLGDAGGDLVGGGGVVIWRKQPLHSTGFYIRRAVHLRSAMILLPNLGFLRVLKLGQLRR